VKNKFYSFEKENENIANVYIYGDITSYEWYENEISAWGFKKELEELGEISELNVHINSYGGETFQALAIYNLLKSLKAQVNVYIDGIAASSASIIAMAGKKIYMPKTALIMIHNCWTYALGNAEELRKTADDMDKVKEAYKAAYLSKIKITEEELEELLADETYLTAPECLDKGFADELIEPEKDNTINQYANKAILNLVNKIKKQDKKQKIELNEETVKEISENVANSIVQNLAKKGEKTKELLDTYQKKPIKEDALASFFNTKK
jgi:ATP-dependent protease ClpP protease subunit